MSEAILNALWDAVTQSVVSLALDSPVDGSLIPVVKRKVVRAEKTLDPIPQITVFRPEQPEFVKYFSFNNRIYKYTFIVAIVYQGNQNLSATQNNGGVDYYSQHRDAIKQNFEVLQSYPVLGVTGAYDMRVKPDVFLPRSMIAIGYDYQAIGVELSASG